MREPECRLSVIVPTCNRAPVLAQALAALERQSTPPETFEIVVCDDGSRDGTPRILEGHARRTRRPFLTLAQANAGANRARNRAIGAARGRLLLILNDDTIAQPDLVARHLAVHDRHSGAETAVLGRMTIAPDLAGGLFAPLHHDASFALIEGRQELDWWFFFTCNVSVHRSRVLEAGGFNEALGWHEDIELGERLARRGMRLFYEPAALGHHWHHLDERAYLRIAEREADALLAWRRARPDLDATLRRLGLSGVAPFGPALRHRLADCASPRWSLPLWCVAARALSALSPAMARALYRRLFQRVKRLAIATRLDLSSPTGGQP